MPIVLHRQFVYPLPGDTLVSIAERQDIGTGEAGAELLLSWNLHLANRLVGSNPGLLGSDIVYVEPPSAL
jgi:hypothetical protein